MGYANAGNEELGSLTDWQLVNKVYEKMLIESKSIRVMVAEHCEYKDHKDSFQGSIDSRTTLIASTGSIVECVKVLNSLLDDGPKDKEFSDTMRSLYQWVLSLLNIIRDANKSEADKLSASDKLVEQCEGFLSIWKEVRH